MKFSGCFLLKECNFMMLLMGCTSKERTPQSFCCYSYSYVYLVPCKNVASNFGAFPLVKGKTKGQNQVLEYFLLWSHITNGGPAKTRYRDQAIIFFLIFGSLSVWC